VYGLLCFLFPVSSSFTLFYEDTLIFSITDKQATKILLAVNISCS